MEEKFDMIIDNGKQIDLNSGQGWVCPKCGNVIAPSILVCPTCGGKRTNEGFAPGESIICS